MRIFIICVLITTVIGFYLWFENTKTEAYTYIQTIIMPASVSFTVAQLIACIVRFVGKEDEHCSYQKSLEKIGIEKIYANRSEDLKNGYIPNLIYEFENPKPIHLKSANPIKPKKSNDTMNLNDPIKSKNFIKMMGISLEFYFHTKGEGRASDDLARCILENIKNFHTQVLICDSDNIELKRRDAYTNILKKDKGVHVKANSNIDLTLKIFELHKINYRQYLCAPYATIVIINDSIYYTPNHIIDKTVPPDLANYKNEGNKINLTYRIKRSSFLGCKIEAEFDAIWDSPNILAKPQNSLQSEMNPPHVNFDNKERSNSQCPEDSFQSAMGSES